MDVTDFIRNKVKKYGFSATARWCRNNGLGNPRWFLLQCADMLPRQPVYTAPTTLADMVRVGRVLNAR